MKYTVLQKPVLMLLMPLLILSNQHHQPTSSPTRPYWLNTASSRDLRFLERKVGLQKRKELQQFHERKVVKPKKPQDLSYEQQRRSLEYLMFMKLKIDEVTSKGRVCADGRKQRDWLSKEDTSSPTVSTEGLMISCMIDAMEGSWYLCGCYLPSFHCVNHKKYHETFSGHGWWQRILLI